MALPGESVCREVSACGNATWGTIPDDPTTQYVQADYAGGDSDGTSAKPWTTVQDAIDAAAPGAVVAIAAGSYVEDLNIEGKAVRLLGRCPSLVEIVGTGATFAAIVFWPGTDGTEIADIAVRNDTTAGIAVSDAQDVVIRRVWLHDLGSDGLHAEDTLGPASVRLEASLIERASGLALVALGGQLEVHSSAIRDTQPRSFDSKRGNGVVALPGEKTGQPSELVVDGCLFERNQEMGIFVVQSEATVTGTLVRDTEPQASDLLGGVGIVAQQDAALTIEGSVMDHNRDIGVFVAGSTATIANTVVTRTQPNAADQHWGEGIEVSHGATAQIRAVTLAENHMFGLSLAGGADAVIEGALVVDTQSDVAIDDYGYGVSSLLGRLTLRGSVVRRSRAVGVFVDGSTASLEGVLVEDTQPRTIDGLGGRGISAQIYRPTHTAASVTVKWSSISNCIEASIYIVDSVASLEATRVSGTTTQPDGTFGDGIAVRTEIGYPAQADVFGSIIERNVRAGVSGFGASVTLGATLIECNAIDLDSETLNGVATSLVDAGGNVCGCPAAGTCKSVTANLAPPDSLQPPPE